jgi:hypothetical protein
LALINANLISVNKRISVFPPLQIDHRVTSERLRSSTVAAGATLNFRGITLRQI